MKAAIDAVPYAASVKIGLQFKRRFWEEDEAIYGGISYTDLPIRQIAYPNTGFNGAGRGVLLGAYLFEGANAYEFTAMPPAERVARAVEFGAGIHPQYKAEFENGVAVAWHRVPFTLGCAGDWTEQGEGGALRQSVPDRRPDRAGGRACLLHSGLAGGRHPVVARCDHAAARACGQDVKRCHRQHGSAGYASRGDRSPCWSSLSACACSLSWRAGAKPPPTPSLR